MKTKYQSFIMQKNKITKSLQVPCSPFFIILKSYLPGKRVLPFTSRKRLEIGKWTQISEPFDASITVEAAFVLPLFVFLSLAVLAPMQWLDAQRKVQTVTEQFCEELSQYAYLSETGLQDVEGKYEAVFSDVAAGIWLNGKVGSYVDAVRVLQSKIPDENANILFELEYQEKIPFFWAELSDVTMKIASKRRCWIGLPGKLKEENTEGNPTYDETGGIEMVYVTPNMGRYHRYRDCRYLSNVCRAVSPRELESLRNLDGKIYYSCENCVDAHNVQNTVYVTTWGTRYHNDRNCASMSNYLRKVPLEDVVHLGECSACMGRRHGN